MATIFLAFVGGALNLQRVISAGARVCAISLCAVAANLLLWFSVLELAGLGFGITISNVSSNITLRSEAPETPRGRVIAFYIAMHFGFKATGGLLAGFAKAALTVQWALFMRAHYYWPTCW